MRRKRQEVPVEPWLLFAIAICLRLGPDLTDDQMADSATRTMPDVPPREFRRALARVRQGVVFHGPDGREAGRWPLARNHPDDAS